MKTLALVESPAQLLNVVEWVHQTKSDPAELTIVVLAPGNEMTRLQLRRTTELVRGLGLSVNWHEPRLGAASTARTVTSLAVELSGLDRLIVGDPFSGVIQVVMAISHASQIIIVDDGTATIEFARLWNSGDELVRWNATSSGGHRRQIASFARRRMTPEAGCRLSLFTCMPVQIDGVTITHNDFSWVRSHHPTARLKRHGDLIGTSLVETGVVDLSHYLRGVESLANQHGLDRYFAHRREDPHKLTQIGRLGLAVLRPELPLELVVRRQPVGATMISFPSTVVHTLPLVLKDTQTKVLVCDIADAWYAREAPVHSNRFLGQVTTSARDRYGLCSVAC